MLRRAAIWALAAGFAACGTGSDPGTGEQHGDSFVRCARRLRETGREIVSLPPLSLERNGGDVDLKGIRRGVVVLGAMAGITEASPANLANVRFFVERFRDAGVQAILVAGGVGLLKKDVDGILGALAEASVPVLVSPGAQESYDVLRASMDEARKRHPQLLDMTRVRRVRIGNATVIAIPGYHRAFYLEAGERGCSYGADDLADAASLVERDRVTVVLSASPPRCSGASAVDRGRGEANIGDVALADMLRASGVRFGIFGHVYESGGHATLADGVTPVPPGVWQDTLFLQAGAVDTVPVLLVGGGRAVGLAHVVEISGERARYRSIAAQPEISRAGFVSPARLGYHAWAGCGSSLPPRV